MPWPTHATRRTAYLAWVAVCILWGTTYMAIRIALETIPPLLIGGFRYTIAGGLLAIAFRSLGGRLPGRANWPGHALLGLLMLGFGNGGVIWGEQSVPTGIAAVIVASSPFWTNTIESFVPGGVRLSARVVSGLFVGACGIILLVWPDLAGARGSGPQFAIGVAALQVACLGWSIGSIYSRRHAPEDSPVGASALQMFFGGVIMLMAGTARGEWSHLTFTMRSAAAEVYLTVLGSLVGYSAFVYALRHLPLSTVSLYAFVNPVIAVLLGTWFLDEPFGWRAGAASVLVFLGVGVVKGGTATAVFRR